MIILLLLVMAYVAAGCAISAFVNYLSKRFDGRFLDLAQIFLAGCFWPIVCVMLSFLACNTAMEAYINRRAVK